MNIGLIIESVNKCQKCVDDTKGEFYEKPSHYNITVKDGLIVCAHCGTPVTSNLEVV